MNKKILIVEDNSQNQKLFKDLLELAGFDVHQAWNGKEGMTIAKEHLPDLIIVDFQLPEMNGLELANILSEDLKTKDIPCVFATASVVKEQKNEIEENGYPVILKPINTRTFVEDVTKFIKR